MIANSIEDLRQEARRRVPRAIFDYADRGSYDEVTFNRNLEDLAALQLRQRVMVDVSQQQLATTVLGEKWTIPVGMKAPQAAGEIHTDIVRGFIRAEIVSYDALVQAGNMNAAKEKGVVRLEGKEYVMQEGDIVNFRFNV